jgi:hypothetical protein
MNVGGHYHAIGIGNLALHKTGFAMQLFTLFETFID